MSSLSFSSSSLDDAHAWLAEAIGLAQQAGQRIMQIYDGAPALVTYKEDGSPLTEADQEAHRIITAGLAALTPQVVVVSEESTPAEMHARHGARLLWMIDPLDGTRQFVQRDGEFTVNIALINNGAPVLGVVYNPRDARTYYAVHNHGAFVMDGDTERSINVKSTPDYTESPTLLTGRTASPSQQSFLANLQAVYAHVHVRVLSSSIKFCMLAEGQGDVYYRAYPSMEWDTAAAQCILEVAGGCVCTLSGAPLRYNKKSLANPHFIASNGDAQWMRYVPI